MNNRFEDPKHQKWAKKVKQRDNFTCQICFRADKYLHSHHLNSYDTFIGDRYNIDNGLTLCYSCHDSYHQIYGKGKNTVFQFKEFIEILKIIQNKFNK